MLIKNFGKISVVADYYQNYYSWGHWCTIDVDNGWIQVKTKIRYYNRTRERFTYQSVIAQTLDELLERMSWSDIDRYKNDIEKLKKFLYTN